MTTDPVRIAAEVIRHHRACCGHTDRHDEYVASAVLIRLTAAGALMPDEAKALRAQKAALITEIEQYAAGLEANNLGPDRVIAIDLRGILARHEGSQT